jgi:diguanylate cyclase (GGDEF)-like protein/PAS domain S-box-containing protein
MSGLKRTGFLMFAIVYCLTYQHDWTLVLLAGALCLASNLGTILFLRSAGRSKGMPRWIWLCVAGAAGGFGIWSTHFVAMLAYDPGIVVGYGRDPTLISLGAAFASTFVAGLAAVSLPPSQSNIAAGLAFGVGVAAMHFIGMAGLQVPGTIVWDRRLVVVALVISVAMAIWGYTLTRNWKGTNRSILAAASVLSLGIVLMHFTAMGALTIVEGGPEAIEPQALSKSVLLVTILVVSISMLASGMSASIIAFRAAKQASASETRFELLLQGVTDYAIYMLDPAGVVTNWNVGAERAKGYSAADIVGQNFARFYSEEDQRNGLPQRALEAALANGRHEAEGMRFRKDGSSFWAHVVIQPVYDDGRLIGYVKITRDITQAKIDGDRIKEVSRNLDLALENMSQGISMFDRNERLILANARYSQLFGFPENFIRPGLAYYEIVRNGYQIAFGDGEAAEARATDHYRRHMATMRSGQKTLVHQTTGGRSILATFNVLADGGWVTTFEDITERLAREEKIAFMAKHDALTGLPNRPTFNDYLSHQLTIAKRLSAKVAVIGIDLDKFKEINDQMGHVAGDFVLSTLAARLNGILRDEELVARLGGDEFAAVKRFGDRAELDDFVARLEAALTEKMEFEEHHIVPGASVGVALYPDAGEDAETLLANADLAMYRAKHEVGHNVCFYDESMDEVSRDRRRLARDLWAAIERDQMYLHYQVQKSVATGKTTGYEVLLRWSHPERGNIPPADFIPIAEECGAIVPIGEWVLREACREAVSWKDDVKIAVNISPIQIAHANIAELVRSVLEETGLPASRLELEITESSIIVDKSKALVAMRALKQQGVAIAIDDFGTGYSSLETLRSFPFDKIKLDRSFMNEVETSQEAKAVIRSILALGRGLSIPVLAEGVETLSQLELLTSEGCDEAQGYYFGRPARMEKQAAALNTAA